MGFLAIFLPALYFGALGGAAAVVLVQFAQLAFALRHEPAKLAVLLPVLPFCGGAFYTTWTLIFSFCGEYLVKFGCDASQFSIFTCDSPAWQAAPGGDTFVEAYRMVTNTAGGWVWSSSLLFFVVPACLWLHLEGTRVGVSRAHQLAFLVLGFLGAISASFPLAFATLHAYQRDGATLDHLRCQSRARASNETPAAAATAAWVALPAGAALASAVLLPYTVAPANAVYVASLATLHGVLLLPALLHRPGHTPTLEARTARNSGIAADVASQAAFGHAAAALLFASVGGAAALQHLHNLCQYAWPRASSITGSRVPGGLLAAGWANPCQASISWDAVLSAGACLAYVAAHASRNNAARNSTGAVGTEVYDGPISAWLFLLAAPLVSTAAAFAAFLACEAAQRALGKGDAARRKVKL